MISLFDPLKLGALSLNNRIVMAPLMHSNASEERVPNDVMRTYYCQRSSAGLIVSEPTSISPQGVGYPNTPGIWCSAQTEAWQKITDAVHKKGGKIMLQLWHVGRVSDPEVIHGQIPVAPSAIACPGIFRATGVQRPFVTPRALHTKEIKSIVTDFAEAAAKARDAGFDGIDINAANGYLIDQFLHDHSNRRKDEYGGSVANRSRFLMEVVDACIGIWGADRVGVHLSPYSGLHGMKDSNPELLFTHISRVLGERRVAFMFIRQAAGKQTLTAQMKQVFGGSVIVNENFNLNSATDALRNNIADAVAFGKGFISNPDLVERFRQGLEIQ